MIPVWLHVVLSRRRGGDGVVQPLLEEAAPEGVVVPVVMAGAMVCISAVAFYTAIRAFWAPDEMTEALVFLL